MWVLSIEICKSYAIPDTLGLELKNCPPYWILYIEKSVDKLHIHNLPFQKPTKYNVTGLKFNYYQLSVSRFIFYSINNRNFAILKPHICCDNAAIKTSFRNECHLIEVPYINFQNHILMG